MRADGASIGRADKRADVVRLFAYGLDVDALKRVVVSLGLTSRLELTQSLEDADAVLALKQRVKARGAFACLLSSRGVLYRLRPQHSSGALENAPACHSPCFRFGWRCGPGAIM